MTNVAMLQTAADLSASITAQGVSSLVPAGVVMPYAGATAPTGWLLCNGSAISRTTYADLFTAISTAHGSGDGSTTFNIPNYAGQFLRGRANGSANDPDRASRTAASAGGNTGDAVGSVQTNSTKTNGVALTGTASFASSTHTHGPGNYRARIALSGSALYMERDVAASYNPTQQSTLTVSAGSGSQTVGATLGGASDTPSATGTVSLGSGDNETRPLNAYVNYIIKI